MLTDKQSSSPVAHLQTKRSIKDGITLLTAQFVGQSKSLRLVPNRYVNKPVKDVPLSRSLFVFVSLYNVVVRLL